MSDLLVRRRPIFVPAVERFVAEEAFTKANGIDKVSDTFKKAMFGKVEESIAADTLGLYELSRYSHNIPIAAALGVHDKGDVALAHVFHLLKAQMGGVSGPLNTSGWATVAFVVGADNEFWVVNIYPLSPSCGGLEAFARPLGNRQGWAAGDFFLGSDRPLFS